MDVDGAAVSQEEQARVQAVVDAAVARFTEQYRVANEAQAERITELESLLAAASLQRTTLEDRPEGSVLKKLFEKPPRFSGTDKNVDVREWLFAMKLLVEASKEADESVKVAFCASNLDGKARSHWLHSAFGSLDGAPGVTPTLIPYTMASFEQVMLAGFGHVDPIQVAWVKLNTLSQGMNDPPEYARQFQALCAELGPSAPTGEALIQFFLRGLNPKLKAKVELKLDGTRWKGEDLQALIRQCTALWPQTIANVMASKTPSQTSASSSLTQEKNGSFTKKRKGNERFAKNGSGPPTPPKKEFQNKKKKLIDGPSGRSLTREQIAEFKKAGKCFKCEQTGHRATDPECPMNKGKSKESEN